MLTQISQAQIWSTRLYLWYHRSKLIMKKITSFQFGSLFQKYIFRSNSFKGVDTVADTSWLNCPTKDLAASPIYWGMHNKCWIRLCCSLFQVLHELLQIVIIICVMFWWFSSPVTLRTITIASYHQSSPVIPNWDSEVPRTLSRGTARCRNKKKKHIN
jgi:hypothetical protein